MSWNQILTQLNQTTAESAVERWGGDISSIKLASHGINVVYRFEKNGQSFYLRMTHPSLRSLKELEAALAFQQYLVGHDVAVCKPVLSQQQRWIESVAQGGAEFLAHVCEAVPGTPITFEINDDAIYHAWGKALAKFHRAATAYEPGQHVYTNWKQSLEELYGYAKKEPSIVQKELNAVAKFLTHYPSDIKSYGLTHGDHRKGNVLTDGHVVNIIDFDIPRLCWFIEDLIRPFFSAIAEESTHWQSKLKPYFEGYQSMTKLTQRDKKAMPWFVRLKALEIYLWTKYNWDSDVAPGGMKTTVWLEQMQRMVECDNQQIKVLQDKLSFSVTAPPTTPKI